MSISRLPPYMLHEIYSFLPLEVAHASARAGRELNQLIHTKEFSRMQLSRLFPGQTSTSPIADYEKMMRIFANFAAVRCGYSEGTSSAGLDFPAHLDRQPSLSLGPFRLSICKDPCSDIHVMIERQSGIAGRIKICNDGTSPNTPSEGWLFSTSKAGVFVVDQPVDDRFHPEDDFILYARLDFSLTQEEILFNFADGGFLAFYYNNFHNKDDNANDDFNNTLNQQDKNAIYWELWFLNRQEVGHRYPDYGRLAFELYERERGYFVPNKDRAEAIFHYSMRLIARRYVAPHGDPLAKRLFNRLPAALRNPVYGELYALRRPPQSEDVWNYGELAFHGLSGRTATNADRRAAILNFVNKGQKVL